MSENEKESSVNEIVKARGVGERGRKREGKGREYG
jgi:hypothetical protein